MIIKKGLSHKEEKKKVKPLLFCYKRNPKSITTNFPPTINDFQDEVVS